MSAPFPVEIEAAPNGYDPSPTPSPAPIDPTKGCSILGDPPEICGNGIDDEGDTSVDEEPDTDFDGISDCDDDDDDNDGYSDLAEIYMGTDPLAACSKSPLHAAWPPDFNNSRSVNIGDVVSMKGVVGSADARHDLDGSGTVNVGDLLALKPVFGQTCS